MTKRVSRWLLTAIVVVVAPFWWLLVARDRGDAPPKPIHIGELRALAAALPGQRPTGVSYAVLATRMAPGDFFTAGIGLKRRSLAIIAFFLPVPGKGPILIDPGAPPAEASVGQFANFDLARADRIAAAAHSAGLVLYTQGPEREPPRPAHRPGKAGIGMAGAERKAAGPGSFPAAHPVAPGVVVIPASSHVAGARLIFVQLANGQEFLFAGNIAPFTENWARLRARSHLAAAWGPAQDRAETYAWLRTIRQLRSEAPALKIVPGHDYAWVTNQRTTGAISDWQPSPPPPPTIAKAGSILR